MPSCSALPELTDEQIDSLPPEVRQTYRQPRAVDPAELVRFLGHTDLVNAAWAFLMPVYVDRDLLSVWPNVDPDFRAVLAQKWVRDNHYQMTVDGWNGEAVEAALAGPPDHPLGAFRARACAVVSGDAARSGDVGNRFSHQDGRPGSRGALRTRRLGAGGRSVAAARSPVRVPGPHASRRQALAGAKSGVGIGPCDYHLNLRGAGGGGWLPAPGYLSRDAVKPHAG